MGIKSNKEIITMRRRVVRIILFILAILFCLGLGASMLKFVRDKEFFREFMEQYGVLGRIIYVVMVIFQVIVAIVPGEPVEIAGGYAFGAIHGTLLYLVGGAIGSMLVFLAVRKYGNMLVETMFSDRDLKGIRFLKDKKHEPLLILLFILPGTPKDLLCYFAGLTNIKTMTWIIVSSLGRIPSIVTSTIGGDAIERENYGWAIVAFAVAMLISISGIIIYRAIHRKHNKQDSSEKCVDEK